MAGTFARDGCLTPLEAINPAMFRTWFQIALVILIGMLRLSGPALGSDPSAPVPVTADELLFGNGTPGPFTLSWTQVQFGSERLSVNGTPLVAGLDYQVAYDTGTLTFAQPLRSGQIARIEYQYDPSTAKPNHGPVQVPLAMRVWGGSSGSLQLIGAVQPTLAPGTTPSATLLGFRGDTALGGGQISSLFLLAPETDGTVSASNWQRAALQFGASHASGPFQFHAAVAQAGADFGQANAYQLQQGLRTLDLSAAFQPSKGLSFSSQVKRQDALDPAHQGKEQASISNQLTLAPASGTKLTFSQESSSKARAQGPAQTVDALRAQLQQQLGSGTVATLTAQRQQTDSTGTTTTTGIDLASRLTSQTRLTAGFVQNTNDQQGRDSTARVGLEAQAAPQLKLHTDFSHRDSAKDGQADALNFGLDAGKQQMLTLAGGYSRTLDEKAGTGSSSNLSLTMRPAAQLGFHIGLKRQLAPGQADTSGMDWGVTAGPKALLSVEGKSTASLAADGQRQQNDQLQIVASPLRGVKVGTLAATQQVGTDAARETRETSLELTPLPALRLAGALRDQEMAEGVAHIRSVTGAIKPVSFLDLSGGYKTRDLPAGDGLVTRNVQLALAPVPGFKLRGSYVENPEDKDGNPMAATDSTLGLDSAIGCLSFGGSYTLGQGTDPAGVAADGSRQRVQSEFRLGLNLWGHSRLYSSYKESQERTDSITLNRTLSLGFTRSLSDNFYLMLEGEMTEVQVNGIPQPGMSDQRAQARLALRF